MNIACRAGFYNHKKRYKAFIEKIVGMLYFTLLLAHISTYYEIMLFLKRLFQIFFKTNYKHSLSVSLELESIR